MADRPDTTNQAYMAVMEEVLLDYVQRFGLTNKARAFFLRDDPGRTNGDPESGAAEHREPAPGA